MTVDGRMLDVETRHEWLKSTVADLTAVKSEVWRDLLVARAEGRAATLVAAKKGPAYRGARNEAIYLEREAGATFKSLAEKYELSAGRISQIHGSYQRRLRFERQYEERKREQREPDARRTEVLPEPRPDYASMPPVYQENPNEL